MTTTKTTTARGLVARLAAPLTAPLARELERMRRAERDQAHYATLGDHPFVGCQPCAPSHPGPSGSGPKTAPAEAPDAKPKA